MTASTAPDVRYPRQAIAEVIESALAGSDYSHVAEWTRPPGCPCHAAGMSCEGYRLTDHPGCPGYIANVSLPPDQGLTAAELAACLPEPDLAGTVSALEAGTALASLASARLAWSPYRQRRLSRVLGDALADFEDSTAGMPARAAPAPGQLRCQYCTDPIPPERGPKARYCKNSHRVIAHKMRKRAEEKAANEMAAGAC
jgi:hypothetical protein